MTYQQLNKKAQNIRQTVIEMLVHAGSGHTAGSLGMADIFTALYFSVLDHDPKKPDWPDRDRLVLSNGHICPVLYACLAEAGYFNKKMLSTMRELGSPLQGHPHRGSLPGIENTSGPLGLGLSQACGMAMAGEMDKKNYSVYCLLSDGEMQCGQTWEALMFAGKNKLKNLTAIIDRNNIQISGTTDQVMPLEPLKAKLEAFNWHVLEIDGHNMSEIINACHEAKAIWNRPVMIIAYTIPGKGVKFMEYDHRWHGIAPNKKQAEKALKQLGPSKPKSGKKK